MSEVLPEIAAKVQEYVDSLRRQAPAAKLIGKYAVDFAWKQTQQRIHLLKKDSPDFAVEDPTESEQVRNEKTDVSFPNSLTDYEMLNARQVLSRVATLSQAEVIDVLHFEQDHRNRATVIAGLRNLIEPPSESQ